MNISNRHEWNSMDSIQKDEANLYMLIWKCPHDIFLGGKRTSFRRQYITQCMYYAPICVNKILTKMSRV